MNITNECNMELMSRYEDNYFDLAIVDPPYKKEVAGLKAGYNRREFNYEALSIPPSKEYLSELFRVSKNQILWGFNYYLELLPNTDSVIAWFKHQNGHFSECEYAWSSIKKSRLFDRSYQKDQYNKIHPTQKPVALMKYLIKTYTKENEIVLDFTMGSGTTGVAATNLNRKFIGIEQDKKYFKIASERINKEEAQKKLF